MSPFRYARYTRVDAESELHGKLLHGHPNALHAVAPSAVVVALTLPFRAGEGNQAVCGKLGQFKAVDAAHDRRTS